EARRSDFAFQSDHRCVPPVCLERQVSANISADRGRSAPDRGEMGKGAQGMVASKPGIECPLVAHRAMQAVRFARRLDFIWLRVCLIQATDEHRSAGCLPRLWSVQVFPACSTQDLAVAVD